MRTPLLLLGLLAAFLPAAALAQPVTPPPRTVTFLYWSQANPPSGLMALPAGARSASSLDLYPFTRSGRAHAEFDGRGGRAEDDRRGAGERIQVER